jgi:hypothetical protein
MTITPMDVAKKAEPVKPDEPHSYFSLFQHFEQAVLSRRSPSFSFPTFLGQRSLAVQHRRVLNGSSP